MLETSHRAVVRRDEIDDWMLSAEQRALLRRLARSAHTAQGVARRARAVLASADGATPQEIAEELGTTPQTVRKWRGRFAAQGLPGLEDRPRPGTPKRILKRAVEAAILKALVESRPGGLRWTTRVMAREIGISQAAVARIWRSVGLQPARGASLELLRQTLIDGGAYRVIGLYMTARGCVAAIGAAPWRGDPEGQEAGYGLRRGVVERLRSSQQAPTRAALVGALEDQLNMVTGPTPSSRGAPRLGAFLEKAQGERRLEEAVHLVGSSPDLWTSRAVQKWLKRHRTCHAHQLGSRSEWLKLTDLWCEGCGLEPSQVALRLHHVARPPLVWVLGRGVLDRESL